MTTTLGAVSLSILSIATPAYLVATIADSGRSDAWMLTLGVMIWAGFRLSVLVTRGRAHLFDVFFWLYSYIFLGLAPTAQIRSDQISLTTPGMDPDLDTPTALIVVLAAGVAARINFNPFEAMTTITVKIVSQLTGDNDFSSPETLVAFALGLTLFVITLGLNVVALIIVRKYREQYE